jgi:hypothetical protein
MRGFRLILLAWVASGCSLLTHFDPETQPCDSAGECAPRYSCSDAGLCHFTDAGVTPDAGGLDGAVCIAHETNCTDGKDDDCDNLTDCLDPDCNGLRCDDKNVCTTGETCIMNACRGTVCNTPPNRCQAATGSCTATGCVYAPLADGTSCGAASASRCCTGNCVDLTLTPTNCGGCGLACSAGQVCQSVNQETTCLPLPPTDTSARCSCNTTALCPGGQDGGQTCASNGFCRPVSATQCAPGQSVDDGGASCGLYCRY